MEIAHLREEGRGRIGWGGGGAYAILFASIANVVSTNEFIRLIIPQMYQEKHVVLGNRSKVWSLSRQIDMSFSHYSFRERVLPSSAGES